MKIKKKVLTELLKKVGFEENKSICIISDLFEFFNNGYLSDLSFNTKLLFETLIDLAENKNLILIFPSFTYSFSKTNRFDLKLSKPETGLLPLYAWKSHLFKRIPSPMTSYLYYGELKFSEKINFSKTTFGKESFANWMFENNSLLISIGVNDTINGWILAHYAEEIKKVPYRYFKKFNGKFYEDGNFKKDITQSHFVRKKKLNLENNYTLLNNNLNLNKFIKKSNVNNCFIKSCLSNDLVNLSMELLDENVNSLI